METDTGKALSGADVKNGRDRSKNYKDEYVVNRANGA
tara:strand:+ start:1044 stop:1154 length:111 start_codon:yes stop_codon:yes gene_type:complete